MLSAISRQLSAISSQQSEESPGFGVLFQVMEHVTVCLFNIQPVTGIFLTTEGTEEIEIKPHNEEEPINYGLYI